MLPMMGDLATECVGSMLGLAAEISNTSEIVIITVSNFSPFDRARNFLIENAINHGARYGCFVDADMVTPQNGFLELVKELLRMNATIVSGHYYRRGFPFTSHWSVTLGNGAKYVDYPKDSGSYEINCCGLGFCVIDLDFVKERLTKPYFKMEYGESEIVTWEDGWFCEKIKKAGGRILGHSGVRCEHLYSREKIGDDSALRLRIAEMPKFNQSEKEI